MNVDNIFPYNEMTLESDSTIGACVKIPKFYVSNTADENGLITRKISQTQKEGYHCHPAFKQHGQERNGILIACDIVQGEPVTLETARQLVEGINGITQTATGSSYGTWTNTLNNTANEIHIYNIFEHHAIALLMLIEYATTNIKSAMGLTEDATTGTYRNIVQHWGDVNLWCEGLGRTSTAIKIFDNSGNFSLVETTQEPKSGYPITVSNLSGENWDLTDIFYAGSISTTATEGSFGTIQQSPLSTFTNYLASYTQLSTPQNNFTLVGQPNTQTGNYRLAKFTD